MYIDNEGDYNFRLDMDKFSPVQHIVEKIIEYDNEGKAIICKRLKTIKKMVDEYGNKVKVITTN